MSVLRAVVKHSVIAIVVWIILVSISIPALLKLDEVTEYRAERLLPNGTESMRANELLSEIMGGYGGLEALAFDVVIVEGVNASDEKLVEWDKLLEDRIKDLAVDYSSPYSMVREILDDMKPELLNSSREMYDLLNQTRYMLSSLRENKELLVEQLNYSALAIHYVKQYLDSIYSNESFNELVDQMYNNLSETPEIYVNISGSFNETVERLSGLKGLMTLIYMMLYAGDQYYTSTLGNLSTIYYNMTMLKQFIILLNNMYYELSLNYTLLLYDVSRIHYYLLYNTTAYRDGLNESIVEDIVRYTNLSGRPVEPNLVNETYHYIVDVYGLNNTDTRTLYNISYDILLEEINQLPIIHRQLCSMFLPIYRDILYNTSMYMLNQSGVESYGEILVSDPVNGQYSLYEHLLTARNQSLPLAVKIFSEEITPLISSFMGIPPEAQPVIENVMWNSYIAGYPLNGSKLEDLVVFSMYNLTSVFMNNTLYNTTITLYRGIYERGSDPSVVKDSLKVFLREAFPAPFNLSDTVYQLIVENDPMGEGLLVRNESLTLDLMLDVVHNMTLIDESILRDLYLGVIDVYRASYLLMKEMIVKYTGREELTVLVDIVYRSNGTVSFNGFREFFEAMFIQYFGVSTGLPVSPTMEGFNLSKALTLIADHLAYKLWFGELSSEYFERFLIGSPIILIVVSYTGNSSSIDELVYSLPVIEAVINGTYDPSNPAILFESLTQAFTSANISFNIGLESTPVELLSESISFNYTYLFEKLYELPVDASEEEVLSTFIDVLVSTINETFSGAESYFSNNDLRELFVEVLINGSDPVDAICSIVSRSMEDGAELSTYIRRSLVEENYTVLYKGMYRAVSSQVFSEFVENMRGQMISPNDDAFLLMFKPVGESSSERYDNALRIRDAVESSLEEYGFKPVYVGVTGDDLLGVEAREANARDIENVQRISMIAPIIIAIILIGGFLVAGLPFLGIAASVAVSSAIVYILGYLDVIDVTSWSRMLLITTSFGLGMDYSTYIILRFKEQLPKLKDPVETAYESVKYALPAITAAASTDIIGFAVMVLAWDFPLIASIGETVPIAIAAVLAASLTLTPALLAFLGGRRWFWWPHRLEAGRHGWRGYLLNRRRSLGLLFLSLLVMGIGVYGLFSFKGSHDYTVFMPENTRGYKAYLKIQELFPAGQLMPIYVVGRLGDGYSLNDSIVVDDVEKLVEEIKSVKGVVVVHSFLEPGNKPREAYVSRDNRSFYLEVIIKPSPMSREGVDLTREIRGLVRKHDHRYYEELLVGGLSASSLEMEELLNKVFWTRVFPAAFILMWIAMSLSFMSIWSGLIALTTIVTGYSIGVSLAYWIPGAYGQPALWFLPLMTLPAVLGVGMDYNSFYMNRQRYELMTSKGSTGYEASTRAIRAVSHLVLGLGLIVTATYSALVIGSSWGVRELGIALSTSILVTTLTSAFILTPVILALMGRRAWWPGSKRWER